MPPVWRDDHGAKEPENRDPQSAPRLALVSFGLGCHSLRLLLLLVSGLVAGVLGLVLWYDPTADAAFNLVWVFVGVALLSLTVLLAFIGSCCCLGVPAPAHARNWMTASLALDALSLLGGAFAIFVGIADPGQLPTEPVVLIAIVAALLGLVSWWCYTVFLQRLASYLWETELVRFTGSVQALGLMLSGLAPILGIGIYACLRWPADATVTVTMIVVHLVVVVLAVGWPVAGIIFLLVQLRLLERLREAMWSRR